MQALLRHIPWVCVSTSGCQKWLHATHTHTRTHAKWPHCINVICNLMRHYWQNAWQVIQLAKQTSVRLSLCVFACLCVSVCVSIWQLCSGNYTTLSGCHLSWHQSQLQDFPLCNFPIWHFPLAILRFPFAFPLYVRLIISLTHCCLIMSRNWPGHAALRPPPSFWPQQNNLILKFS